MYRINAKEVNLSSLSVQGYVQSFISLIEKVILISGYMIRKADRRNYTLIFIIHAYTNRFVAKKDVHIGHDLHQGLLEELADERS